MQGTAISPEKGTARRHHVLDFSAYWLDLIAPWCCRPGARVIKIEKLGTGDDTRAFGPFCRRKSAYFMCFNRGKERLL